MKKLTIFALLILFLTSCGNNFKVYSKAEKKEVVEKIFKNDTNAKVQYDNILKELNSEMKKGNKQAKSELEEWELLYRDEKAMQKSDPSENKSSGIFEMKRNK